MSYYFYLDKTLLPIAPEKISMKINNQNKTINLINEGQVNVVKGAGLTDISFEALIPAVEYPFTKYKNGFVKPYEFIKTFEKLKADKQPFQFIVTRTRPDGQILFDTNITVTLESYSITESVKEGFDVRVSFDLKQYKEYGTKQIVTVDSVATAQGSTRTTKKKSETTEQTYRVVSGDCLWSIAKKFYGDGSKYPKIYKANQDIIDKRNKGTGLDKYTIYTGQVFTIPT